MPPVLRVGMNHGFGEQISDVGQSFEAHYRFSLKGLSTNIAMFNYIPIFVG